MTTHNLLMSMRDSQNCLASQVLQSNHEMMDVAGAVPPPAAVRSTALAGAPTLPPFRSWCALMHHRLARRLRMRRLPP